MIFRLSLVIVFILNNTFRVCADEGMWLPIFLKQLNEKEMKNLGMKLKAEDIYSINKGSLKDAVVLFGGGCTGEIVSKEGLLFTNHHCGYGQIQSLSSLEHNYLTDGFWAKNKSEELKCPGLTVTFISRIEDVSSRVLEGVSPAMSETDRQSQIDKNLEKLKTSFQKESYEDLSIKPFYAGNQYFAFVSVTYKDIRLVGTPPERIGKFGSDTDNWVWPRHTGDFSVFRVYAGSNNLPAEYSANNKPLVPKHHFPISLKGVKEGDFTMVFGFPGKTDEYLPSFAVKQTAEKINPIRIALRDKALKIMDAKMRTDAGIKIQYASKYASIANYWKKWIGESQGLLSTKAYEKKKRYEEEFLKSINTNPTWKASYSSLLPEFNNAYSEVEQYAVAREGIAEIFSRITDIFKLSNQVLQAVKSFEKQGDKGFETSKESILKGLPGFYKNYNAEIDKEMFVSMVSIYKQKMPASFVPANIKNLSEKELASIYETSSLINEATFKSILQMPNKEAIEKLSNDPLVKLNKEVNEFNQNNLAPKANELQGQIAILLRKYMKAQMEVFSNKKMYPDANSTMRVSYGKVKSYQPRDAVKYTMQTTIDGVMEKYIPGDYEFDVDARYRSLYDKKDYGRYGQNGTLPVCFLGSNHTTGGNSGSPAIDARGNLIGINFDRVWEGTMSDINYDASICRNIMVDIRYVLWVIDKYAGAKNLIDEMTIIQK